MILIIAPKWARCLTKTSEEAVRIPKSPQPKSELMQQARAKNRWKRGRAEERAECDKNKLTWLLKKVCTNLDGSDETKTLVTFPLPRFLLGSMVVMGDLNKEREMTCF